MKKLNKNNYEKRDLTPRIIQFGEGNFMRAFVDWQVQQLNNNNIFNGSCTVIQPLAKGMEDKFASQDYLYTVILEGLMNNETVHSTEIIDSISTLLNTYEHYDEYLALADVDSYEIIVSNTTEAGIAFVETDKLEDRPQKSFPGKLTALLYARYTKGKNGFTIIPCELIDRNGDKLKEIVLQYVELWNLGDDFKRWILEENTFCCSLVDRIVPGYPREKAEEYQESLGYQDELMVVGEPFYLWVIEVAKDKQHLIPFAQNGHNVVLTEDMTPYRERKVHLLNGPHTAMVPLGIMAKLSTVEDVMNNETLYPFILDLMEKEIIPTLDLPSDELHSFAHAVIERFKNPFMNHQLSSIALNSISKFKARLLPVIINTYNENEQLPNRIVFSLSALIRLYKGDICELIDDEEILSFFKKAWSNPDTLVASVLSNSELWGQDLTQLKGLQEMVQENINLLNNEDILKLISTFE